MAPTPAAFIHRLFRDHDGTPTADINTTPTAKRPRSVRLIVPVADLDHKTAQRVGSIIGFGQTVGIDGATMRRMVADQCGLWLLRDHGGEQWTNPEQYGGQSSTTTTTPTTEQESTTVTTEQTTTTTSATADAAADALKDAIEIITAATRGGTDEETVRRIVAEMIESHRPSTTITIGDLPTTDLGDEIVHESFEKVVRTLVRFPISGRSAFLYGPPGSGKTYTAEQAARAVGLSCAIVACEPSLMPSALRGFIDATGTYRSTAFREAYENGGVVVFDEIDNAPPSITVGLINAAVTASSMVFPDGVVRRSPNFRVILTGNTDGNGPTAGFSGRFPLDDSTNDRCRPIFYGYDERVLRAMVGAVVAADVVDSIVAAVDQIRRNLTDGGIRGNITPRAALAAAVMVADGESWEDIVTEALLPAGLRNGDNRRRAMADVVPFV